MNDVIFILKNFLKRLKIFSISKKVTLSNLILFSAIVTIFYSYSNFVIYPTLKQNVENQIKYTIKFLENDIKVALDFESERNIKNILNKAVSFKEILGLEIREDKKILFSKYSKDFKPPSKLNLTEYITLFENIQESCFIVSHPLKSNSKLHLILYYSAKDFLATLNHYKKFTFYVAFVFFILILILSFFIKLFLLPFTKLAIEIKRIDFDNLKITKIETIKTKDERGEIINSFIDMIERISKAFKEIENLNKNLENKVLEKTKELKELNISLADRVKNEIKKNREKDKILIQQSKLASMGEMIGNIAHQWRQPLNALGIILQGLEYAQKRDKLTEERINSSVEKGMRLINKMSTTIDDFRNFFKPTKLKQKFFIGDAIENSLDLVNASLENNQISINFIKDEDIEILGFENELSQVIVNLINNAKDAIKDNEIKNGKIEVELKKENSLALIKIQDNGCGISEKIKDRIFEPYFTTKEQGKGTGVGLYMSKSIIESMNGSLSVENVNLTECVGACFTIELPIKN